jgi:UDP-N-acetylglucosamine 1-carboxyvinyltransferase
MQKFVIIGGKKLSGVTRVSGAKNVATKALVAACLTDQPLIIKNIPLISDFIVMTQIIQEIGGEVTIRDHELEVRVSDIKKTKIGLERAAEIRTSAMFMSPLLVRCGEAIIPNPGGCRIGARPIDRTIVGLEKMGAQIEYKSEDGYFYMKAPNGLRGVNYRFNKNTHTGTETLILAAVLADGTTVLDNAAQEPEIDELISLLNLMGAKIKKTGERQVTITGVSKLSGAEFTISPDRNEIVTVAIGALITQGDILIKDAHNADLDAFLEKVESAGGGVEKTSDGIRFFYKGDLRSVDVTTSVYPGFMTDWQGPWAVLMTKVKGECVIHETVYENRFSYVSELRKMGGKIDLFNPKVEDPQSFYNFNVEDDKSEFKHAAKILGETRLHNAVVRITDLRAGATLVLAALAATGESVLLEVEHLDRGYEKLDERLGALGADIKRESE